MRPSATLRQVVLLTSTILGFGLLFLFGYVLVAPIFGEGTSPVDAYWLGRLPWMAMAERLVVIGAGACVVAGSVSVLAGGGWLRRILLLPALAPVALWWVNALMPVVGAYCANCPPAQGDPFTYAYSLPGLTGLLLLVPAVFITVLALSGRVESASSGLAH